VVQVHREAQARAVQVLQGKAIMVVMVWPETVAVAVVQVG
jgi:hypothetical protein